MEETFEPTTSEDDGDYEDEGEDDPEIALATTRQDAATSPINWVNASTPVKNQGSCGSCWAFTAIGVYETMISIKTKKKAVPLSEQEYTSCVQGGCNGGWMTNAWQYSITKGGAAFASDWKYTSGTTGQGGDCNKTLTRRSRKPLNNSWFYPRTVEEIKTYLGTKGPLAVAVSVSGNFGSYKTGIYNGDCQDAINHGVIMTGWGVDSTTGGEYWILRNSWGTWWGDKGFMKITTEGNKCNVRGYPVGMAVK
jgi:C1A family cysteine protease